MCLVSKIIMNFYKLQGYKTISQFSRRRKPEKLPVHAVFSFLHLKKEQFSVCVLGQLHLDESSSCCFFLNLALLRK